MIKVNVASKELNRILVNSSSSVDILYKTTLDETRIIYLWLEYTNTSLKGFNGGKLVSLRVVELSVTFGLRTFEKTMMLDFIVVEEGNPYQMIAKGSCDIVK